MAKVRSSVASAKRSFALTLGLALIGWPSLLFGTAQVPEVLIYKGEQQPMTATPLENLFSKQRPKPPIFPTTDPACRRGYIGTWEIREGALWLLSLRREFQVERDGELGTEIENIPLREVFPDHDGPIFAGWFSGSLRIPRGELLRDVPIGFGSVYEEDVLIRVASGVVIGTRLVHNDPKMDLSDSELAWRETGRLVAGGGVAVPEPDADALAETGDWIDGVGMREQFTGLAESQEVVRVRGYFFGDKLWFPSAGRSRSWDLAVDTPDLAGLPEAGVPVELTGSLQVFSAGPDNAEWERIRFVAIEVRPLIPGEAVQRRRPLADD